MRKTTVNETKSLNVSQKLIFVTLLSLIFMVLVFFCRGGSDAARKVYVAPGEKDELYAFLSGGYSGQVTVHGIPSGRLIKIIPVFSLHPENGYGMEEETKEMLRTSHGLIPWDDSHHPELSMKKAEHDGRWLFINGNNTPRIARIDLRYFETKEIIEIPNSAGNHASPFSTENTEYVMAATRFSVPVPQKDVSIESFSQGAFHGIITMVKVNPKDGRMSVFLQARVPGFNYDLSNCGKGPSADWCFFCSYNTEQAWKMQEIEASKNDKDMILAFNWKKAEQCKSKARTVSGVHYNNYHPANKPTISKRINTVSMINASDCPGAFYYLPTPKSPHGVDVDPTGEYIVGGGKLSAQMPVHSFSKFQKAIGEKSNVTKTIESIPVLKYESTLYGEVQKKEKEKGERFACLGPLHTQFDSDGRAFTSCFLSSNVIVWDVKTLEILENLPSYYSVGHLTVAGGHTRAPYGKYMITLNKITQDRYLPTGMELAHAAQLYDISGGRSEMLLDFPTMGEPHYGQMIEASKIASKSARIFKLNENKHPYATLEEKKARMVRNGKVVHVYMTAQLTHFKPDKVELKVGDQVYFHVTNLTQKFDIPHGFAIYGAPISNILIMPGQTKSIFWSPKKAGIYPFYCTDFCSALHQEMQNYIRVSN